MKKIKNSDDYIKSLKWMLFIIINIFAFFIGIKLAEYLDKKFIIDKELIVLNECILQSEKTDECKIIMYKYENRK